MITKSWSMMTATGGWKCIRDFKQETSVGIKNQLSSKHVSAGLYFKHLTVTWGDYCEVRSSQTKLAPTKASLFPDSFILKAWLLIMPDELHFSGNCFLMTSVTVRLYEFVMIISWISWSTWSPPGSVGKLILLKLHSVDRENDMTDLKV